MNTIMKPKIKWLFCIECTSENIEELSNDFLRELWEIPQSSVVGITKERVNET